VARASATALGPAAGVIIIGGIYSGIFTATGSRAVSGVYAFFVAVYVYGEIGLKDVRACLALGKLERDAALHHHQRGAVLVRARQREHPERARRLAARAQSRAVGLPARGEPAAARRRNFMDRPRSS